MTIEQLVTETKRKWKKIIRTLKRSKPKQGSVSPINSKITISCSSYAGTVDARDEISLERYDIFSKRPDQIESLPPFPVTNENLLEPRPMSFYENSTFSYDSAYDTDHSRKSSMYDRSSSSDYQNIDNSRRKEMKEHCYSCDKDDCTSIATETTWLEYDLTEGVENKQNVVNESIELLTTL